MALASPALFCVATKCRVVPVGCSSANMSSTAPQKVLARMFGVQRSSVKLVDRTLHRIVFGQLSTTHRRNHR